tara:strand:+ start:111 stop:776 length:666 start_codon:yes stop_codon:yes gene_type:complete
MKIIIFYILLYLKISYCENIPSAAFSITRIQYDGGGDWYADPSSLPNLLNYIKENTNISIYPHEKRAKIGEPAFLASNYLYLTGHGNIKFNNKEIQILREHLLNGAFLHADDNYGMDKSFRREIRKIFPEKEWVELPASHQIFNIYYKFPNGIPKIHEHDNKRPQALGLYNKGNLMILYTYETDLGDGWEDPSVHDNPDQTHINSLKMGTNIVLYILTNND